MNKKDIKTFDEMIKEAWNDDNAFCKKLKEYIGKHFEYVPELKERCKEMKCEHFKGCPACQGVTNEHSYNRYCLLKKDEVIEAVYIRDLEYESDDFKNNDF